MRNPGTLPTPFRRLLVYPVSPITRFYIAAGFGASGASYANIKDAAGRPVIHTGLDYNLISGGDTDLGQPVYCMADGVVVHASNSSTLGFGRLVVVEHPQLKLWSRYAHLGATAVKPGQIVAAGNQLGTIGKSGKQKFAHLHFDVLRELPPHWRHWPGANRAAFERYYVNPITLFSALAAKDRVEVLA